MARFNQTQPTQHKHKSRNHRPAPAPPPLPPPPPPPPPPPWKPVLKGVLDRQALPSTSWQGIVNNFVCKVNWADLQTTKGGPIRTNNAIDQAIQAARAANRVNPSLNMRIKVRIYTGSGAPSWALNIGGAPFTMTAQGNSATIGRWWLPDYVAAYQTLQQLLAILYDNEPLIADINISGTSAVFAEPLQRDAGDAQSITNLLNAGYSFAADDAAIHSQINIHRDTWHQTRSSFDATPFQHINSDGSMVVDETYSESIIDYLRQQMPWAVLGMNTLKTSAQGPAYAPLYDKITRMGPPIYFQTATADKIGDWQQALQMGIDRGANYIELPIGYTGWSSGSLAHYDQVLEAQPTGAV